MNGKFAAAFLAAQKEIGKAPKDSTNPHFKNKYASLEAVESACLPALHKNGIAVLQPTAIVDGQPILRTILLHESGESMESVYPLRSEKETPQGYGSALTYARRYCLASMVGVVQEDDDGNAASQRTPAPQPQAPAMDMLSKLKAALAKAKSMDKLNEFAVAWDQRLADGEINVAEAEAGRKAIREAMTKMEAA